MDFEIILMGHFDSDYFTRSILIPMARKILKPEGKGYVAVCCAGGAILSAQWLSKRNEGKYGKKYT